MAAITAGRRVPSARFRVRQLLDALRREGVDVHELVPAVSSFPPAARWARPLWGVLALGARLPLVAATHRYAMTLIQREMLSTLVTLERWTCAPRVFDVDDAIFLYRGGQPAERIARMCDSVICGNAFLADWFSRRHSSVVIIPTAVDTSHYQPHRTRAPDEATVIGWIGTSGNLKYLYQIEQALAVVLGHHSTAKLLVVSDAKPRFGSISNDRVEYRSWAEEREVASLGDMSIGIMPLEDSPWARGKCSFKMLLYLACGLPVVASPVGMNAEIFALGSLGIPARTQDEWVDALDLLVSDAEIRRSMGATGRGLVQKHFSVEAIAPRLALHLRSVAGFVTGREGP